MEATSIQTLPKPVIFVQYLDNRFLSLSVIASEVPRKYGKIKLAYKINLRSLFQVAGNLVECTSQFKTDVL